MANTKINIGDRFGRLEVVSFEGHARSSSGRSKLLVKCRCDCDGNEKVYVAANLLNGDTKSCGCLKPERCRETHLGNKYGFKHGFSKTRLYKQFIAMRQRCNNPNATHADRYCLRGIYIDDGWDKTDDFVDYREWCLANGYDPNAPKKTQTINRIDNDGPYAPWNCEWTTSQKVQMNNTGANHLVTHNGETHTVAEWADITGINYSTIENRLVNGWDDDKAIEVEPERNITFLENNGCNYSISNWCYVTGLPQSTISSRIARNNETNDKTMDEILFKPGRHYPLNAIYFTDDDGLPINEEEYDNGKRKGRGNFEV